MATGLTTLIVWNEAVKLADLVIAAARRLHGPGALALADQLVRAADSVHSNIAEGYGRGPGRDQQRMYRLARGSLIEVDGSFGRRRGPGDWWRNWRIRQSGRQ